MRVILVPALALCFVSAAADNNPVVPIEAEALTKAHGCVQLYDYFVDRPAAEDPPYALVSGDFARLNIAVWCSRPNTASTHEVQYLLLLRIDDASNPLGKCPAVIAGEDRVGGLRFGKVRGDAAQFYWLDSRKPVGLRGTLSTEGIYSIYDGTGRIFICVGERWAAQSVD